MYNPYWQPYCHLYPFSCTSYYFNPQAYLIPYNHSLLNSLRQVQTNQTMILHKLESLQHQLKELHSKSGNLDRTDHAPITTHIHNEFDKFEIYLDSIDISTLSGTMQIGLFNHGVTPGTLPSSQASTAPSASPATTSQPMTAPQPTGSPQFGGLPEGSLQPQSGVPPVGLIPSGFGLVPGEEASPQTLLPPGTGQPPGVPPTAPEAEHPPGEPTPGIPPGAIPTPARNFVS